MDGQALFLKIEKWVNARKEEFPLDADNKEAWHELGDLMESLGATIKSHAAAVPEAPEPAEADARTPADHGIFDPGFGKDIRVDEGGEPISADGDDDTALGDDD